MPVRANARAIFDGEVSAVFQYNGLTNVLVRHGSYISVYCNLSTVRVKKGSLVRARDVLGEIHTNAEGETILHFQLRKETVKLNPEGETESGTLDTSLKIAQVSEHKSGAWAITVENILKC